MEIQKALIEWYQANHRLLIFRENKDPYSIWVSEIMAQQTRIDTMLAYYERWMDKYPTIKDLACAPLSDVLKSWEGLGYYNRARKLHEGASFVLNHYNGELPANVKELEEIPGIGKYTAGAIASIAFNLKAPAVDGNVLRVITRLFRYGDDITSIKTQKKVYEHVYELMEDGNPSDFTQGLMELGALICTPMNPSCNTCPLANQCLANEYNEQSIYPNKKAKKAPQIINLRPLILINNQDQIILSNECDDNLMEGYMRLPECPNEEYISKCERYDVKKHVFSHRIWKMEVYINKQFDDQLQEKWQWISMKELDKIAIVTAHRKIITEYIKKLNR